MEFLLLPLKVQIIPKRPFLDGKTFRRLAQRKKFVYFLDYFSETLLGEEFTQFRSSKLTSNTQWTVTANQD